MKKFRLFISIILIISLIGVVNAATGERVANGGFDGSISGWNQYTYGTASISYDPGTTGAKLYTNSNSAVARIYQNVYLTDVNTLSVTYQTGADWHTTATFKVKLDGVTELYSNPNPTGGTTANLDVSGYTGYHEIWIYVITGTSGYPDTAYVTDVTAPYTVIYPSNPKILADGNSGKYYTAPNTEINITGTYTIGNTYQSNFTRFECNSTYGTAGVDFDWVDRLGDQYDYTTTPNVGKFIEFYNNGEYLIQYRQQEYDADANSYTVYNMSGLWINISASDYDWTLNFFDTTGSPITNNLNLVLYTDTVLNSTSTNEGSIKYYNLDPATYALEITSDSVYQAKTQYVTLSADTTTNVTLTSVAGGVSYAPHNVKFRVINTWGNPVTGATITALTSESSSPLSWIENWLGISPDIDINGTELSGITGSDGVVSFMMIETVKYDLTVVRNSTTLETMSLYPVDDTYDIYVSTDSWWSSGGNVNEDIEISVSGIINADDTDYAYVNSTYTDASAATTYVSIHLNQTNPLNPSGSETILQSSSVSGQSSFSNSFIVSDYAGESYIIRFTITNSEYGTITREYSVSFEGETIGFGIPDELLPWVGILFLVFIGAIFGVSSATNGMIVVCFFGWAFFLCGWFEALGTGITLSLTLATIVSIAAIIMRKQREAGYR